MITENPFGYAKLYTLENSNGMKVQITNYGGIITSLEVPSPSGKIIDIALGYRRLTDYTEASSNPYFGATIGRFGNRIAEGKFTLDGKPYSLAINNGVNHLHGGKKGFDQLLWKATPSLIDEVPTITLNHLSPDGEENYPGNLQVTVTYRLLKCNTLEIEYRAVTDQATPINLTNHSYFNLEGEGHSSILEHELQLFADRFTPINSILIPTGEIRSVQKTPFDFLNSKNIGKEINAADQQLEFARGYDHNMILTQEKNSDGLSKVASVKAPYSGIQMEVSTTEPAVQFYTGNFLDGSLKGKQGKPYGFRSGFCLETQHYPDSPNQPQFPNTILRPNEIFQTKTRYHFR